MGREPTHTQLQNYVPKPPGYRLLVCLILLNEKASGSGSDSKSIEDTVRLVAVAAVVAGFVVVAGFAVAVGVLVAVVLSVDFLDDAAAGWPVGDSAGKVFVCLSPVKVTHTYASHRQLAKCA